MSTPWMNLQYALIENTPACEGNQLFIEDGIDGSILEPICDSCPVFTQCHEYATTAKNLTGGYWAKKHYSRTRERYITK